MTDTTEFKATPSIVPSEIAHLRNGFAVLRGMLYDVRDMEVEITPETLARLIWTADHVKAEVDEAAEHVQELVDDERAAVAARRSAVVLQAAE